MRKELDEELCKKYPEIFRDRHGDMTQTLMCWGFEHGDGWFNIIDMACAAIKNRLDNNKSNIEFREREMKRREMAAAGDWSFLEEKISNSYYKDKPHLIDIEKQSYLSPPGDHVWYARPIEKIPDVVAVQIKEKYGTLRFYYDGGDDYISGIVAMAENMSARTCEQCGAPGKPRRGGWIRTLCDKHAAKYDYQDTEEDLDI